MSTARLVFDMRKEWRLVLAATGVLCAACAAAWGSVSVTVRDTGDVWLKDSRTGKSTKFVTVKDALQSESLYTAEYRNGRVYLIKERKGGSTHGGSHSYEYELWSYDKKGHGVKLWSAPNLEFRVGGDGRMIAVLSYDPPAADGETLRLIKPDGRLVKTYSRKDMAVTAVYFERWQGSCLWVREEDEMDILSFIRIDTPSLHFRKYAVPPVVTAEDYDLNIKTRRLAYSNYPPMFDTDSLHDFEKTKTAVELRVYSLETKREQLIAKSVAKSFEPKWVNSTILAFNNPKGKGRIRQHISL